MSPVAIERVRVGPHGDCLDTVGRRDADCGGAFAQPGFELIDDLADSITDCVAPAVGDVQETDAAEQAVQARRHD